MLRSKGMGVYIFVQSVTVTYNQYVNPIALAAIGEPLPASLHPTPHVFDVVDRSSHVPRRSANGL